MPRAAWAILLAFAVLYVAPARASESTSRGAIVVAAPSSSHDAKALARLVYADARLRPPIDEATARVLVAGASVEAEENHRAIAETVVALGSATISVRQRLLQSLGQQLSAELVLFVETVGEGSRARVLRSDEGRFLSLMLTRRGKTWPDAAAVLRGLLKRAAETAGGVAPLPPVAPPAEPSDGSAVFPVGDDDSSTNLLTSPWFWGGLGVVVTVGVTVLVLSQTALNEPDTVIVDGRVAP